MVVLIGEDRKNKSKNYLVLIEVIWNKLSK